MATGSTSPLAATAAEQEPPESVTKKQKLSYDEKVSFVIPSGDVFQISRAALSCEPFKDGLLRRLVESELPTERDANGAIKLGVECSRDAFQRVVDEYEWALRLRSDDCVEEVKPFKVFLIDCWVIDDGRRRLH